MTDFVFRDRPDGGLDFIGDFEGLYRADHDPWGQSAGAGDAQARYFEHSRSRLIKTFDGITYDADRPPTIGIELGCGSGYALSELALLTDMVWHGVDISPTAIERAKLIIPPFPNLGELAALDVMTETFCGWARSHWPNVVVLNQMLWYVLDRMDELMDNLAAIGPEYLVISQAFLRGEQRYMPNVSGFAGTLAKMIAYPGWKLIRADFDGLGDPSLAHDDGIIVLRRIGGTEGNSECR